jgi:hypothetical protein
MSGSPESGMFPPFDRKFFDADEDFTVIGGGELGGKALGLASAKRMLEAAFPPEAVPGVSVTIPRLTVLGNGSLRAVHGQERPVRRRPGRLCPMSGSPTRSSKRNSPAFVGDLRALVARVPHAAGGALFQPAGGCPPASPCRCLRHQDDPEQPGPWASASRSSPRRSSSSGPRRSFATQELHARHRPVRSRTSGWPWSFRKLSANAGDRFYPDCLRRHPHAQLLPEWPGDPRRRCREPRTGAWQDDRRRRRHLDVQPAFPRASPARSGRLATCSRTRRRSSGRCMDPAPYDPVDEAEYLVQSGLDDAEWDDVRASPPRPTMQVPID